MATPAATPMDQATTHQPTLFLAFELGVNTWNLSFTTGAAQRPREHVSLATRLCLGSSLVLLC
jgi:hypothetical protein